jgi:hypothetical protein
MTDDVDGFDETDKPDDWQSENNGENDATREDLARLLARYKTSTPTPVPASLLERTDDGGPWFHYSDASTPGVLVFGRATYTDEQIAAAFRRARLFKYGIVDARPEWLEQLQDAGTPTAEGTLQQALEYDVPEIVPRGVKAVYRPNFNECATILRSLWKAMDEVWANSFGEPVPQMPIITPDYLTVEDQIHNALRIVRAWCAKRCNPEPGKVSRRNRPTKADRDEEFTRQKDAGNASKDIATWWNNQHPDDPKIDAGIVDTAVSRCRKRKTT